MSQAWLKCPEMTKEEWLSWRKEGIGGSDAPCIMGKGYGTPFQVYEEKVLDKHRKENWAMKWGKIDEPQARRDFEDLVGRRMAPANIENTTYRWYHASLDGLCPNGEYVVEIKKTSEEDHKTVLKGFVPDKYVDQCQHIMKGMGKEWMHFYSSPCDKAVKGKILEVARDFNYTDSVLFPAEEKFWNMVVNRQPPELTERDVTCMEKSKKWAEKSKKWKEAKKALSELECMERQCRDALIALSKDRNAKGCGVSLSKSIVKGAVDYTRALQDYISSMKANYPDVVFPEIALDLYRKDPFVKWMLRDMD